MWFEQAHDDMTAAPNACIHARQMAILKAIAQGQHPPVPLLLCGPTGTGKHTVLDTYLRMLWKWGGGKAPSCSDGGGSGSGSSGGSGGRGEDDDNVNLNRFPPPPSETVRSQLDDGRTDPDDAAPPLTYVQSPVHVYCDVRHGGFLTRRILQTLARPLLSENAVHAKFRVVVLDGVEAMHLGDQELLRNLVERPSTANASNTCQFVFVCNSSGNTPAAYLRSRCLVLAFPAWTRHQLQQGLGMQVKQHRLELNASQQTALVEEHVSATTSVSPITIAERGMPVLLANAIVRAAWHEQRGSGGGGGRKRTSAAAKVVVFPNAPPATPAMPTAAAAAAAAARESIPMPPPPYQACALDVHTNRLCWMMLDVASHDGGNNMALVETMQRQISLLIAHTQGREQAFCAVLMRRVGQVLLQGVWTEATAAVVDAGIRLSHELRVRGVDAQLCTEAFCFAVLHAARTSIV